MKFEEIAELSASELAAKDRELRAELFNLKLQQASARLEKPTNIRNLRRAIAKVQTRLSQLRNQGEVNS